MQRVIFRGLGFLLLAAMALPAAAADDVVMKAMRDELDRSMKQLQLEQLEKPYFISYHVQDRTSLDTSATFGALLSGGLARARYLTVQVRVGSYQSDNSNFMTYPPAANGLAENILLPVDDDYQELRRQIWLATDEAYKEALEMLSRKRGALENRKAREEPSRLQQGGSGHLARALFAHQNGPRPSPGFGEKPLRPLPSITGNLYVFGQRGGHRHPLLVPQ